MNRAPVTVLFPKKKIGGTMTVRTAWTDHVGNPFRLDIEASKLYWSDPRMKNLPYDQARAEIAKDREEVVAEASYIEVDWSSGKKQIMPFSFSREVGSPKFVISGEPSGSIMINEKPSGPSRDLSPLG